jgi:hypothetical protein
MLLHLKEAEKEGKPLGGLLSYASSAQVTKKAERSYYSIAKSFVLAKYRVLLQHRWFRRDVLYVFIAVGAWHALNFTRMFVLWRQSRLELAQVERFGFFEWGYVISTAVAALLILVGALVYWRSYTTGLRWFRRALLVGILLVSFFSFYHNQLSALVGVVVQALLLYGLEFLIASTKKN